MTTFEAAVEGGSLVGDVTGHGPEMLLLHGGPGLTDYLGPLAEELSAEFTVARYTQRGVAPSTEEGDLTVEAHVADVLGVLAHLGWERPVLGGHSWGGNLVMHVLAAHSDAARAGLVIDPLGAVGDGGMAEFAAELDRRVPATNRPRLDELNAQEEREGTLPAGLALEQLALVWPGYFPDASAAPAMPPLGIATRQVEAWNDMMAQLPALTDRLRGCSVPTVFLHGERSPMPVAASRESAALMTQARVEVVPGAGHFVWDDHPGVVLAAARLLVS